MSILGGAALFLSGLAFGVLACKVRRKRVCQKCRLSISATHAKVLAQYMDQLEGKNQEISRLHDALRNEQIKNAELYKKLSA